MVNLCRVFVTVGTTKFSKLTDMLQDDDVLHYLQLVGCKHLIIQHGSASPMPSDIKEICQTKYGISVECYDYKPNILNDIVGSDLVISHAGAGSCTEILSANKPLIVVVNDDLMDNHQTELAHQLSVDGYLLYCFPNTLVQTLSSLNETIPTLRGYERDDNSMKKLVDHLAMLMGFR